MSIEFLPLLLILLLASISSFKFNSIRTSKYNNNNHNKNPIIKMTIEYRNVRESDINAIGILCADVFEGPFNWLQGFERIRAEENSRVSIGQRYRNFVCKNMKHSMIIAVDSDTKDIVGFLEVGQLPPPINEMNDKGEYEEQADVSYLGKCTDVFKQSYCNRVIHRPSI